MTGRPKLEDVVAACNMIKSIRKYRKKLKHKGIKIPLDIIDVLLRSQIIVGYNPSTENITISSCGISHGINCIYPTKFKKLKCINQHTLDVLKKKRETSIMWNKSKRY